MTQPPPALVLSTDVIRAELHRLVDLERLLAGVIRTVGQRWAAVAATLGPAAADPMSTPSDSSSSRYRIPHTPQELLAMQQSSSADRPEKPEPQSNARVQEVMALIDRLDTSAADDQQIALRLLRRLESFHDEVVDEMRDDSDASHNQIVAWAVDADRLMRSRLLLDSVNLD